MCEWCGSLHGNLLNHSNHSGDVACKLSLLLLTYASPNSFTCSNSPFVVVRLDWMTVVVAMSTHVPEWKCMCNFQPRDGKKCVVCKIEW